jgi:Zn-dependent protease with chaperone function
MTSRRGPTGEPAEIGASRVASRGVGGRLLVQLPWFLVSLVIVSILGTIPGYPVGWLVIAAWLLSAAVALWSPPWRLLTRRVLRLREPTGLEKDRLMLTVGPVAHVAGVSSSSLEFGVRDVDVPLASAAPGKVLAVTRWAAMSLPPRQLEAVLAREVGRQDWALGPVGLVAYWYSIPARLLLGAARGLARAVGTVTSAIPIVGRVIAVFGVVSWLGMIVTNQIQGGGLLGLIWFATPVVAPALLALFARSAEKRADRAAVRLGYGESLIDVFQLWQTSEDAMSAVPRHREQLLALQPSPNSRVRSLDKAITRNRRP